MLRECMRELSLNWGFRLTLFELGSWTDCRSSSLCDILILGSFKKTSAHISAFLY